VRWPGKIPAGKKSDEIVHITDWFTTLLRMSGLNVPNDRVIDGVDQSRFLFGQQEHSPGSPSAQTTQGLPSPEELDKKTAKMQEQLAKMQEQMRRIQQTQDPKERQKLLREHWASMQNMMAMMHEAWGGMMGGRGMMGGGAGMMGGAGMRGHTMGGMMWGDYSQLSPEQLKQRQYMMDRWMPMQQQMMDQMMQHQYWMGQTEASK
jgi:arylsulfatase A-like enzyme